MKHSHLIIACMSVLVSLFLFARPAVPQLDKSPESIFYKANSYYEEGRYEEAVEEYSSLLERGLESGNLYFNLGNSYFKKGESGQAIVNYERAKRLIPRDGDLKSNYRFAQSKIPSNRGDEASWIKKILAPFHVFTVNEITLILSILWTSLFSFLTAGVFSVKARRYGYLIVVVLIIISLPLAWSLYSKVSALDREVVIISENAEARFEPLDNATTHFTLYEGMMGYILDSKKEWIKIRRQDGKSGWIRDREIERI